MLCFKFQVSDDRARDSDVSVAAAICLASGRASGLGAKIKGLTRCVGTDLAQKELEEIQQQQLRTRRSRLVLLRLREEVTVD